MTWMGFLIGTRISQTDAEFFIKHEVHEGSTKEFF